MQICVTDEVLKRNAQKALFSVDVSFRCELQKMSKKAAFIPQSEILQQHHGQRLLFFFNTAIASEALLHSI